MKKLTGNLFFKVLSLILINCFLLLDIAWAGCSEIVQIRNSDTLAAPVEISQQIFSDIFSKLYQSNVSDTHDSRESAYEDGTEQEFVLEKFLNSKETTFQELSADILLLCGNDDINTFKEALGLYKAGKVKKVLLTGGYGRLTASLAEVAGSMGFDVASGLSEAEMIFQIMQPLAKLMDVKLNKDDFYLETGSTNTPENFRLSIPYIEQIKRVLGQDKVTVAYMQVPHQQFRTVATFNRFKADWESLGVTGISYTIDWDANALSEDKKVEMIVSELWRTVIYSAKGDLVPLYGDREEIEVLPDSYWKETMELISKSSPKLREKIRQGLFDLSQGVKVDGKSILSAKEKLQQILENNGVISQVNLNALIDFVYDIPKTSDAITVTDTSKIERIRIPETDNSFSLTESAI